MKVMCKTTHVEMNLNPLVHHCHSLLLTNILLEVECVILLYESAKLSEHTE